MHKFALDTATIVYWMYWTCNIPVKLYWFNFGHLHNLFLVGISIIVCERES